MLTEQQISYNRDRFIELISSINREGADIQKLITKLNNSDFFYAPASTQYHGAYYGGLCEHSLNVYDNFKMLVENKKGLDPCCYDEDTIKIITLLHDISKMNIYEVGIKNEKIYCENGNQSDELGRYRWQSFKIFKTKAKKFTYGSHEATSEYIIRQFIPLELDESVAILHHMGSMAWDSAKDNIGEVFNQYSLALILYMSDMMSSYIDERTVNE